MTSLGSPSHCSHAHSEETLIPAARSSRRSILASSVNLRRKLSTRKPLALLPLAHRDRAEPWRRTAPDALWSANM